MISAISKWSSANSLNLDKSTILWFSNKLVCDTLLCSSSQQSSINPHFSRAWLRYYCFYLKDICGTNLDVSDFDVSKLGVAQLSASGTIRCSETETVYTTQKGITL